MNVLLPDNITADAVLANDRPRLWDFRARHLYEVTDGPELKKVNEHGEIKSGTIDAKELSAYKVETFGRIFGLTFQAMVNDDIGALSDISGKMTRGARRWFETLLLDTIIRNLEAAGKIAIQLLLL